jgi:hypothetical protein
MIVYPAELMRSLACFPEDILIRRLGSLNCHAAGESAAFGGG